MTDKIGRRPDFFEEYEAERVNLTEKHDEPLNGAANLRNKYWRNSKYIPKWVNIDNVGLDQFFTRPEIAKECWISFVNYIQKTGHNFEDYKFIEPSAGLGAFFNLMPPNKKIGIDIDSFSDDYLRTDFLSWSPEKDGAKYACVGNPPFGYRAWLALSFVNHAAKFSDFVAFILPMAFQSRGKSNVQDRVKGMQLMHSEILPPNSFIDRDGKSLKVNALWQIWEKRDALSGGSVKTCNDYIENFTVDFRKERLCGQNRFREADFFLQRTFYSNPPTIVKDFGQVKYVCGYGIIIKKNKEKITEILKDADWKKHSNLASHNCRHISMCHIRDVVIENGFYDA